jgi:hypothetical protein
MDQRDYHCPYSLSSEITAKPTVLGFTCVLPLVAQTRFITLIFFNATAGQEDPFELDSNLLLSSGRHGADCKRQYFCTNMKHRYLTIWLTYCTNYGIAFNGLVFKQNGRMFLLAWAF